MEACATAHHWGREITKLGHTVRLMPPRYVKPYVKRHKNDQADAEAICEAVQRPTLRFVPIKTVEQQGTLVIHRVRETLVGQKTQLINALRGHLAEFGIIAPQGASKVVQLTMRLGGISKAGDGCLRRMLVNGARAVMRWAWTLSPWLAKLLARRPVNVAVVALANKTARIAWAVMTRGETYRRPEPEPVGV